MAKAAKAVSNKVVIKAQAIVAGADVLVQQREHWQQNEYARSNTRLYDILAEVLKMYEQVKDDKVLRGETAKQMKQQLSAAGVRTQANTLVLTLFVRYVFRTERQRALNYSRTLQAALSEGITADRLAGFIESCGGVEQCKKQFIKSAKVVDKETAIADAMPLVEEQLTERESQPLAVFNVPAEFVADTHDKDFMFVLAKADADGKVKALSAIPAQTAGMTKWAKQQLALFLCNKTAAATKSAKAKRKENAISNAKSAKEKSPAASETVGDLIEA
jgi:hypothetical protein